MIRCADCYFKFQPTVGKGRPAKVCPSCRNARKDKWHRDAAKREEKDMDWVPAVAPEKIPRNKGDARDADKERLHKKVGK